MKYFPCPLHRLVLFLKETVKVVPVFYQRETVQQHFPFEDVMNMQVQSQTAPSQVTDRGHCAPLNR